MGKKIRKELPIATINLIGSPAAVKAMEDLLDLDKKFEQRLTTELAETARRVVAEHGDMGKKTYEIDVSHLAPNALLLYARGRLRAAETAVKGRALVSINREKSDDS